jgi:hypothetical protein
MEVFMTKRLHSHISGMKQLPGAMDSLPKVLDDGQVLMAIYTHNKNNDIVVKGFAVAEGHYEDRIAMPVSTDHIVLGPDCWLGGDTGGFYYEVDPNLILDYDTTFTPLPDCY